MSFRRLRILLLLGLLAAAVSLTWLEQFMVRGWRTPLDVAVIPINGDGSAQTTETIRTLQAADFSDINAFLERETARYGVKQWQAMQLTLLPEIKAIPPAPPRDGKFDPVTKHYICKRCGLYATREQVSNIREKVNRRDPTKEDKHYDYLDWWQKSKKDKI